MPENKTIEEQRLELYRREVIAKERIALALSALALKHGSVDYRPFFVKRGSRHEEAKTLIDDHNERIRI